MQTVTASSAAYRAARVAGSCRLEGIKVNKEQEMLMARIISGEIDASKAIRNKVASIKSRALFK